MALPYPMTGSGNSALASALCIMASFGNISFGSFLPFTCIPQMLNPFSISAPSVKSTEVTESGRGGNTSWNSASPDSGIQNSLSGVIPMPERS